MIKKVRGAAASKQLVMEAATHGLTGVRKAASLAARSIARMEAAAQAVHAEANGGRGFQAVSSKDGFSAIIKHGKTLIEINGDDFTVRQTD
jgi:hypothetical protein